MWRGFGIFIHFYCFKCKCRPITDTAFTSARGLKLSSAKDFQTPRPVLVYDSMVVASSAKHTSHTAVHGLLLLQSHPCTIESWTFLVQNSPLKIKKVIKWPFRVILNYLLLTGQGTMIRVTPSAGPTPLFISHPVSAWYYYDLQGWKHFRSGSPLVQGPSISWCFALQALYYQWSLRHFGSRSPLVQGPPFTWCLSLHCNS